MELAETLKLLVPAALSFIVGIGITPILTYYLYRYKAWKKASGKKALDGSVAEVFNSLHKDTETKTTPRMGGIVIWVSVFITALVLALVAEITPSLADLSFISRGQTWIPLACLLLGGLAGMIDDLLEIRESKGFSKGLSLPIRLSIVSVLALGVGWWFHSRLDVVSVSIPFDGVLILGALIVPLFVLIAAAVYASGVIDGIDGLAGGVFALIFGAYSAIAFVYGQYDLAAFGSAVTGGLLAFLWFNVPPARFYMSETGSMGLTLTIAVMAFMTDSLVGGVGISLLPIVGIVLVATVLSNMLQVLSKKIRKKKLFRIAPLHHHFEALGWPREKVVMRYWIITAVAAVVGIVLATVA